jgi:putative PIN family toxin of toxin-antitoxin system
VVLDTSVMVAAIRSGAGASRRLLVAALERRFILLASVPLMIEYESVMTRPEHLAISGLTASDVGQLLDAATYVMEPVRLAFLWRPMSRDPNDDMVLETAVNGSADVLATFNVRDFADAAERFGVSVLKPGEVVMRLEATR